MRLVLCDDYEQLSVQVARIVESQITLKYNSVLGLATGSTPIGLYENLVRMYNRSEISFKDIITFNLDEYYPISESNAQSYHYYMNKYLFSKVDIDKNNIHILNGLAENPDDECKNFEVEIERCNGIDLQILGIGQNGHIGFNEPDMNLDSFTHLTKLTQSTIKANSRFFDNVSDVPTKALTMGVGTIFKAKKIVLLASGRNKREVVSKLCDGKISTDIPASILNIHSDVTLICDKEAYLV